MDRTVRYYSGVFFIFIYSSFCGAVSLSPSELFLDEGKFYHSTYSLILGHPTNFDFFSKAENILKVSTDGQKNEEKKIFIPQEYSLYTLTLQPTTYDLPKLVVAPLIKHKNVFINFYPDEARRKIIDELRKKDKNVAYKAMTQTDPLDDCRTENPVYGAIPHCIAFNDLGILVVLKKEDGKPDSVVYSLRGETILTTKKTPNERVSIVEETWRGEQAEKIKKDKEGTRMEVLSQAEVANNANLTGVINDGNGNPTSGIVSLVGYQTFAIAAVAPHQADGVFGGDGSALSLIVPHGHKTSLEPVDIYSGEIGKNRPYLLDCNPEKGIAYQTKVHLGNSVVFHWDPKLQRLFVGLDVTRADSTQSGGGTSLLVGYMKPATPEQIAYNKNIVETNTTLQKNNQPQKHEKRFYRFGLRPLYHASHEKHDSIVSFFRNGDGHAMRSVVHGIRTLHTTTDKAYLIVNGGTTTTQAHNRVYAIPLVYPPQKKGAQVDSSTHEVECEGSFDSLPSDDRSNWVGGGPLPSAETTPISSFFIVNDAVYVGLAGETPSARGLFKSHPVYKSDGTIAGWTRWQRAFGICDSVHSAFFDPFEFRCSYVTDMSHESKKTIAVKIPIWEKAKPTSSNVLSSLHALNTINPIRNIYSYNELTPSFTQNAFSLLLAHNTNTIALLETGNNERGEFLPLARDDNRPVEVKTDGHAASNCKGMLISGGDLNELQFIQTAAISRASRGTKGYVFVGGYNGFAVLCNEQGEGWNAEQGLSSNFAELSSEFRFKKVGDFKNIRKIESDEKYVYILTNKALFRIELQAANFAAAGTPIVEEIQGLQKIGAIVFSDCLVLPSLVLVGTNEGVYWAEKSALNDSKELDPWKSIKVHGKSLGWVVKFSTDSAVARNGSPCFIVHVLETLLTNNVSFMHRLAIQDDRCELVCGPGKERACLSFGRRENLFYNLGDVVMYQPTYRRGEKSNLNYSPFMNNSSSYLRGLKLNIDNIYDPEFKIDTFVQESASGGLIVSGSEGVRIFE